MAKEVIKNKCWIVHGLLSRDECFQLVQAGQSDGIEGKVASGDTRHRNNCKLLIEDPQLAITLWKRVKDIVPEELNISDPSSPPEGLQTDSVKEMQGRWHPYGVNSFFTLLYYKNGGHFGPHRDSFVVKSHHERSIMTLAVYLVDRPANHGGGTNFLRDDMDCPAVDKSGRIRSPGECIELHIDSDEAGKALIFLHDLMHEGEALEVRREDGSLDETVEAAPKWLLITQVLYRRDPSSAPILTLEQKEARKFLKEAEEAEITGDIALAIKKYNKAYRLDRSLEEL